MPEKQKKQSLFSNPRFKYGSLATALTAVFIAAVIIINIIASVITSRFPSVDLDLTSDRLNSLSEESLTIARSITMDIEIILLSTRQTLEQDEYYKRLVILLDKYTETNPKIKTTYIDLVSDPTFANEYPSETLSQWDVIVKSPLRYRHLDEDKLFLSDSDYVYSVLELSLSASLLAVAVDEMPIVYYTTENNENNSSIDSYWDLLESNAFDVREFNLLTDTAEPNGDLMVMNAPTTDLTTKQISNLESYLYNNGSYGRSLMVSFLGGQPKLPNLEAFLTKWGITIESDVVWEDDANYYDTEKYVIFPNVGSAQIMNGFIPSSYRYYFMLVNSRSMTLETNLETSVLPLLVTSDTAFPAPPSTAGTDWPSDDIRGSKVVAAVSTKSVDISNSESVESSVYVMGSLSVFASEVINTSGLSNSQLALAIARAGTSTVDEDIEVDIPPVQLAVRDITADSTVKNFWGITVFSIVLPSLIFALGIFVFFRRRRL